MEIICPSCNQPFTQLFYNQKYCSPKCQKHHWELTNLDKRRVIRRRWNDNNRERRREINRAYAKRHPQKQIQINRRWSARNPEKINAQIYARNIPLASNCQRCNTTERLERHHPDYSKPGEIITLCHSCHSQLHTEQGSYPQQF